MPSITDHPASDRVQALILGESGVGKTGLLASLANAGYKIVIHDFDNGLDVLSNSKYLTDEGRKNVCFYTYDVSNPASLGLFQKRLNDGVPEDTLPPVMSLGAGYVLVIDSGTFLGKAIRSHWESKSKYNDPRKMFGDVYNSLATLFEFLKGPKVQCNFIVNTHIKYSENEQGIQKGYPSFLGRAFPDEAGRYFNNIWRIDVKPGPEGKRVIRTRADGMTPLKCSAPDAVATEEPFDLAALFNKVKGKSQ